MGIGIDRRYFFTESKITYMTLYIYTNAYLTTNEYTNYIRMCPHSEVRLRVSIGSRCHPEY